MRFKRKDHFKGTHDASRTLYNVAVSTTPGGLMISSLRAITSNSMKRILPTITTLDRYTGGLSLADKYSPYVNDSSAAAKEKERERESATIEETSCQAIH